MMPLESTLLDARVVLRHGTAAHWSRDRAMRALGVEGSRVSGSTGMSLPGRRRLLNAQAMTRRAHLPRAFAAV